MTRGNDWDAPTGPVEVQVGWPGRRALDRCPLSCISAALFSGIKSAIFYDVTKVQLFRVVDSLLLTSLLRKAA
jgi:hypothetical protein